ncbi:hypothetical protein COLO4_13302 [Corchorus olitorius]|uniref:Uncharacterized protein n=1 Tax=Corchorus olitorius TaxID=93759 RepID=A0A1R3JX23_9ROSI|nr:hypothetical protein COLO4_13302 [Corchorus olitorius]
MGEVPPPTPTDPPQKFQKAQLTPHHSCFGQLPQVPHTRHPTPFIRVKAKSR